MRKLLIFLLALGLSPLLRATAFTASVTGDWSNPTTWGGSGPPGSGDTATINTAVTVTVSDARTIGTSGATGTAALTVNGSTGVLTISSTGSLTLQGDLNENQGATINFNGNLTFDPPVGSTYKINEANANGSGAPTINITGTSNTEVVLTTSARGGGNFFFSAGGFNMPVVNWQFFKMTNCGAAAQNCVDYQASTSAHAITLKNGQFVGDGNTFFAPGTTTSPIVVDAIDWRNCQDATFCARIEGSNTPSSAIFTNLTAYNSSLKQFEFVVKGGQIGKSLLGGDASDTPGFISYNTRLIMSLPNSQNTIVRSFFIVTDINGGDNISPYALNNQVFQDGIVYNHTSNQHEISGSGTGSLASNLYQRLICDGDGFENTDAGDFIIDAAAHTQRNNIIINSCGTNFTIGAAAAAVTELNDTSYKAYGGSIGETVSAANNLAAMRNNLFILPFPSQCTQNGNNDCDGIHQSTAFVRQSFTLANWDYNGFFAQPGSGDAGAGSVNTTSPAMLKIGGVGSYVQFPSFAVNSNTSKAATLSGTTLTCATCNFLGGTGETNVQQSDYVVDLSQSGRPSNLVSSVTDATHLVLVATTGFVSGDNFSFFKSYSSTAGKVYGTDWGSHDAHCDPAFFDNTRTIPAWDTANGGAGTTASVGSQIVKLNGFDSSGNATTFNASYGVANALNYIRTGFTPTASCVKQAGAPADGSPDLGAVQISVPGASLKGNVKIVGGGGVI